MVHSRTVMVRPLELEPHRGAGETAVERMLSMMWRRDYRAVVDELLTASVPAQTRHPLVTGRSRTGRGMRPPRAQPRTGRVATATAPPDRHRATSWSRMTGRGCVRRGAQRGRRRLPVGAPRQATRCRARTHGPAARRTARGRRTVGGWPGRDARARRSSGRP